MAAARKPRIPDAAAQAALARLEAHAGVSVEARERQGDPDTAWTARWTDHNGKAAEESHTDPDELAALISHLKAYYEDHGGLPELAEVRGLRGAGGA